MVSARFSTPAVRKVNTQDEWAGHDRSARGRRARRTRNRKKPVDPDKLELEREDAEQVDYKKNSTARDLDPRPKIMSFPLPRGEGRVRGSQLK